MTSLRKKSNILLVSFTKNNIICTLTDLSGNVLLWTTSGSLKSRGIKKITTVTILSIVKILYNSTKQLNYNQTYVKLKGINKNKVIFVKYLKAVGFNIVSIWNSLTLPHNGCRKIRSRRI